MMRLALGAVLLALATLAVAAPDARAEKVYRFGAGNELGFTVSHPLRKGVRGYSKELRGSITLPDTAAFDQARILVSIPVTTFVSHRAGLTQHMFSTINATRYPEVVFRSKVVKVRSSRKAAGASVVEGDISGAVLFHGLERPITAPFSAKITADAVSAETAFEFLLSDFQIERPRFLALALDDRVRIDGKLQASR